MQHQTNDALIDCMTKKPVATGGVLALGNFDGVHLGHRAVIQAAIKEGKRLGLEPHVLTFEPHPYSLFKQDGGPFLLTPTGLKNELLHKEGAKQIVTIAFTPDFAKKLPEAFVDEFLIKACQVKHVVVGFDFVFGRGRGGDRDALRKKLAAHGVGMTEVGPQRDQRGEIISSSRIRAYLRHGEVEKAQELLGRVFTIEGKVQHGDQRGRKMNFPTANIALGEIVRPQFGVYAARTRRCGEKEWLCGVANIGIRPSIGGEQELLEVHIFDFDKEIYGEKWEVALCRFLRPEKAFASLDALKAQIKQDAEQANTYLMKHQG